MTKKKSKKQSTFEIIYEGLVPTEYNETPNSFLGDVFYILFLVISFPFAVILDVMKRS